MVQLKQVSMRLKSVKSIQKITKTMKMVSASKFTKAERDLLGARPFGEGPRKFYQSSQLVKGLMDDDEQKKKGKQAAQPPPEPKSEVQVLEDEKLKRIYIAVTSDKGLCGGVHSGVSRRIRNDMRQRKAKGETHKLVCIGNKSRGLLRNLFSQNMLITFNEIGRVAPIFADAAVIATAIADSRFTYDIGDIYYNKYFSPIKYELTALPIFSKTMIENAPNMIAFDDIDEGDLLSYVEWTSAALIYYALKEGAASEQSARIAAMENANKNAAEMIKKLTLLFNRTRQSVITRELIEIISGAAALK